MQYCYQDTPIGQLLLAGQHNRLQYLGFAGSKPLTQWAYNRQEFSAAKKQLKEYFNCERTKFTCPFLLTGTSFQMQVLQKVAMVPYGDTVSYSDIANQIDNPKAVRAIGLANSKNPLPIIIPCHRVIGKNGNLTGFGGGLDTKKFLLDLERA